MSDPQLRLAPYLSPRHGSNAWALNPAVVSAWKAGDQLRVPPMTMEYAPLVTCNADCYGCPFRRSRLRIGDALLEDGRVAAEDDVHASTVETARRVVRAAFDGGVRGILWTGGGEPTVWAPLPEMLAVSRDLGVSNALYTNGFTLGTDHALVLKLLDPRSGLAFIRISINAVNDAVTQRHWGVDSKFVRPQLDGLANLLDARNQLASRVHGHPLPSIQVSTIVDRQNVHDLEAVCESVAAIFKKHRKAQGQEDRFIVRPMTFHGRPRYSVNDHSNAVITKIIEVCGTNGIGRAALTGADVDVFLGFGLDAIQAGRAPNYSSLLELTYAQRGLSLAAGLFLIVGPDGAVHLSTEHNTNPVWAFGNLRTQSVQEIYASEKRRTFFDAANAQRWGPEVAQATSRTARLDRIAAAIHKGALDDADIAQIAEIAVNSSHSLILD